MRAVVSVGMAMMLAAGCATVPAAPGNGDLQQISYETGPCFGACPVYRLTVNADGRGSFEGIRFTAVQGSRPFTVSPSQFRAFAEALAAARPNAGAVRYDGPPLCKRMATDMPSVDVRWHSAGGAEQSLYFYYGCDMETNAGLGQRLKDAVKELPVESLIRPPAAKS